ncbi:response regulator transcription factor [Cellulomonas sp. Leaf395]|uniref:response regulator transcription factor n=1 Tax=Cellulomonas sp. Leaf395 TaxID=1736362 RepID=UPI000A786CA1|nr:response regulator transcription factor [Cellulomonas sp. Leaf395]
MTGPTPLRVVLCDDSGIFREGLRLLLESAGVTVAAAVADVPALREAVADAQPDVALVDVRLPPTHSDEGIRAAVDLRRAHPALGVLVLSTYVDARWALTLLDAVTDRVGYLLKDRVDDVAGLVAALVRVAGGGVALDPEVVSSLVAARRRAAPLDGLTDRELDVLAAMAQGLSNAGIAEALVVSVKTVESHVAAVFRALRLDEAASDNRRVKAALVYLGAEPDPQLRRKLGSDRGSHQQP